MAKTKFDNIKNRVLLVVIVFLLSYLLTALIDKEYTTWFFGGELSFVDYMIDFGVSLLISFVFVELSVFYSSWSFRLVSFTDKPYLRLFMDQRKNLRVFFFKHTTSSVYIKRMPYLLPL